MGTLDPFASGVLLLGIGKATKFANDVFLLRKRYRGIISLGARTDTLDSTGSVVEEAAVEHLDDEKLLEVANGFLGPQSQIPPIFSAKKVQGKRSYQLAREKKEVSLKAHSIEIYQMGLTLDGARTLGIDVTCSTGTYVRSLARDVAQRLGTCGFLSQLERISIGPIEVEKCLEPDQLSQLTVAAYREPVANLLPQFPEILLPENCFDDLRHGRHHRVDEPLPPKFLGVLGQGDAFKAVFRCDFDATHQTIIPRMLCYEKS